MTRTMNRRLTAVATTGAVAALVVVGYGLVWQEMVRASYEPISYMEPAFEPRVIEPLVDPPEIRYGYRNTFGYSVARHNPADDSVTITYFDITDGQNDRCVWPFCGTSPGATGTTHTQTYHVNQTFAYVCRDFEEHTKVYLYQYRGTSMFQGARSFVLVHFEMEIPERVPCTFPDYLIHTVDLYDASRFDQIYDLDYYRGAPEGAGVPYTTYVEPVRYAVPVTPLYVDPYLLSRTDDALDGYDGWITDIGYNSDGSITVTRQDTRHDIHVPGTDHTSTYVPGQTFLAHCMDWGGAAELNIYNYRGKETIEYDSEYVEALIFANFRAYTRAPMPCTFPDVVDATTDAFDASRFDRQYDIADMI